MLQVQISSTQIYFFDMSPLDRQKLSIIYKHKIFFSMLVQNLYNDVMETGSDSLFMCYSKSSFKK